MSQYLSVHVRQERWPRLVGQHVLGLKWRLAVFYLCGGVPCR
jgi:hypothetical protein